MKNLIAAAAFTAAIFAQSAMAQNALPQQDGSALISESVDYSDLDLSNEAGRARLDHRIRIAIQQVCGTASDSDLEGKNEVRRCRAATRDRIANIRDIAIASAARPSPISIVSGRDPADGKGADGSAQN
ncbi:MAG: UrcA family protein [Sphingosinicella sp.]|nr:UrcA family protein [Sphingosinicella sp.]